VRGIAFLEESATRKSPRYESETKCCVGAVCLTLAAIHLVVPPASLLAQEPALAGASGLIRESASVTERDSLELAVLPSGPLFRASDLVYAGLFFGSLAAIRPFDELDEALSPDRLPSGAPRTFASVGDVAGNGLVDYAASGAVFLTGKLIGDRRIARLGVRSLEALLVADLLVTPFKVGVGRMRPGGQGAHTDADEFVPLSFATGYNSFPSGHTAHMFAIASTLSREFRYEAPWVPFVAYPIATLVGASRVVGQKHWVTDVVAGAAVGLFAGHFIGRLHGEEFIGLRVTPVVSAGRDGVYVGARVALP